MQEIKLGTKLETSKLVTPDLAIDFLGPMGPKVLATPNLIWALEFAARDSILGMLDPGEDSVGTYIAIKHLAATPVGMRVVFRATVTAVAKTTVTFACEAFDSVEKVAEGIHERVVINVARFADSVLKKAASIR